MSIENTRQRKVRPTHPGEMLREDFLPDYGLTISNFAKMIKVSRQTVNELIRERRAVSPEMALRLSRLFGNTPEFWLNAQRAVDLWEASHSIKREIDHILKLKPNRRPAQLHDLQRRPGSNQRLYRAGEGRGCG